MCYAHWCKESTIKEITTKVDYQEKIAASGIPIISKEKEAYIAKGDGHTLVIGSTGSGKTQSIILPLVHLSLNAEESLVVNDPKGEIYKRTAGAFKKEGYEVVCLDFDKSIYGSTWNPLTISYDLYKEGNRDEAVKELNNIGYYLITSTDKELDPFWTNSAIDYFVGITLYLYETAKKEEINLQNILRLSNKILTFPEEYIKKFQENEYIYQIIASIIMSPKDTLGGIISTFESKFKKLVINDNLKNTMLESSFDLKQLQQKKMAIFIISGFNNIGDSLIPLFVNQIFTTSDTYGNNNKKVNIILDEFDRMLPINNFSSVINYSRSLGLCFTVTVKSYLDLVNIYGKEKSETLKACFTNIIYLLSQDIDTLKEISYLCGRESEKKDLITVEELKTMKNFEAIYIMLRVMPFRTILTPDWKIKWRVSAEPVDLPLREKRP